MGLMRKAVEFIKEVRAELAKVVWPERGKAARLTVMVVIITALFGVFIGGVDYGLGKGIQYVISQADKKATPAPAGQGEAGQGQPVPAGGGAGAVPAGGQVPAGLPAGQNQGQ